MEDNYQTLLAEILEDGEAMNFAIEDLKHFVAASLQDPNAADSHDCVWHIAQSVGDIALNLRHAAERLEKIGRERHTASKEIAA
jgi:glutamine synthetase type III